MTLARVTDVGSIGLVYDQFPSELPAGAWSDAVNARFRDGYVWKAPGYQNALGTPSVAPYGVFYTPTVGGTRLFAYLGLDQAFCTDGTTHTEITRAAGVYTGAATDKWVGTNLSGIFCCTNGVDTPQFWVPDTGNDLAALSNWTSNHYCKSIRAFKNHLFALNVTENTTAYPYLVRWSHPADPGAVPSSWDVTDDTVDAGQIDLADTTGPVIDGAALNDTFIVWKGNATYAFRYVGPPFIFSSQKITEQSGILCRNAWCETPLGLVVLTQGDVVVQTGDKAPSSIIDGKNRKWLFAIMSSDNYANSFLVHNEDAAEVWVCFPTSGATWPDKALVWHYPSNTWGIRTLPSVSAGCIGEVGSASVTWDSLSGTGWDLSTSIWDAGVSQLVTPSVVMASAANTKLYRMDSTELADGSAQTSSVERTGLAFDSPERVKLCRGIRPRFDGDTGATINVYVGASMDYDTSPTWAGPYTFTIGTSLKVDALVTGRYLACRFESTGVDTWRLKGVDWDIEAMGAY